MKPISSYNKHRILYEVSKALEKELDYKLPVFLANIEYAKNPPNKDHAIITDLVLISKDNSLTKRTNIHDIKTIKKFAKNYNKPLSLQAVTLMYDYCPVYKTHIQTGQYHIHITNSHPMCPEMNND